MIYIQWSNFDGHQGDTLIINVFRKNTYHLLHSSHGENIRINDDIDLDTLYTLIIEKTSGVDGLISIQDYDCEAVEYLDPYDNDFDSNIKNCVERMLQ
jgi:hypothetical protein